MKPMDVLILALATWRLTSLLVSEDGPLEVFAKLRHLCGVRLDEQSCAYGTNWLAKGLCCVFCVSTWTGFVWAALYLWLGQGIVWLALPLALSAGAIVIQSFVNR